jgi:glycosyltransferase involved in cell wall biosynthesis
MLHKLDWLHDLDIEYDSSTFDTDPFEPQPDGMATIFPVWVDAERRRSEIEDRRSKLEDRGSARDPRVTRGDPPRNQKSKSDFSASAFQHFSVSDAPRPRGYVELPYTLVQDFNLFIVLQEKTIDIWTRKLAWIAQQGGMALTDTHPDYMAFGAGPITKGDEYSVAHYRHFLEHIRETYEGKYWHALPRDVAAFYKRACPETERPWKGRACMVSYSFYESDNRVRRYAETLVKQGYLVDAFSLKPRNAKADTEVIDGVTVHHLQGRQKDEKSQFDYLTRLARFGINSAKLLTANHRRAPYDLVHVHNPPDFLVFAAWYAKLKGARIILDIHDVVPELYANKFPAGAEFVVKALEWVEMMSMKMADHVIVSNHLWHEKLVRRSVPAEKTSVLVNHVDPALFYRRPRMRDANGKVSLVFPGSLSRHQGLDLAIAAVDKLRKTVPDLELEIYGVGQAKPDLVDMVDRLELNRHVHFRDVVPLHQVADIMANADIGVVPKRADSFGNEAYSTKIMEFMSQGVPVIVSRTRIDNFYFDDSVVCFFEPENVDNLAEKIAQLARDKAYRQTLGERGFAYAQRHSWDQKKGEYLQLVTELVGKS